MHILKPSVQERQSSLSVVRKEEVTPICLQMSYAPDTWSFVVDKPAPVFRKCGVQLTVVHVLVDCPFYAETWDICHLHVVHYLTCLVMIGLASLIFYAFSKVT